MFFCWCKHTLYTNTVLQLQWLRKEMDTMWDRASEDVQSTYGKEYFESIYTGTVEAAKEAAKTTGPVIDSMEDAVTNVKPRIRYLVDGSCKLIDINNVSVTCLNIQCDR